MGAKALSYSNSLSLTRKRCIRSGGGTGYLTGVWIYRCCGGFVSLILFRTKIVLNTYSVYDKTLGIALIFVS